MKIVLIFFALMMVSIALADQTRLGEFDVTDGKLEPSDSGHLMIRSQEFRATLRHPTQQHVTVTFKYLGPSNQVAHLQNGEVRHQLGIKLKAQDICNLVYAMWNFDTQQVAVSVKKNRGQAKSTECLDHGYINKMSSVEVTVPTKPVNPDEWHSLTVELIAHHLAIIADGAIVWKGSIVEDADDFDGPVGIRTDNVKVLFDFSVEQ